MYKTTFILLTISITACTQTSAPNTTRIKPGAMCTEDARQCPDGSWIGRSGPRCEFICPPPPPSN